ncbi:glutamine--tRNA ligase/YqeY domain fusion protein [Pendulispora brunnea]|uniref:Glutamine--tRNA ligase n=1 Tax=Pendulispora brunnea TaxID=2905690 RepID=A0ABZ2K9Z0_9BACT
MSADPSPPPAKPTDFIREKVAADQQVNKYGGRVATRFPPEPNGYLHIGHAKSICLNFGIAQDFNGVCHLRMDDTNPTTEDPEYVAAIQRDVRWLGFDWGENMFYASDYYEKLYELAEKLITLGRAYVCDLSEDQMAEYRGTVGQPGKESPYRNRTVEENLDRFRRMRKGEFPEGSCTLRGKIDMTSPNMKMRDPPLYRIKHAHHYRTGDAWCIYPLYDFAHCLSDSIERITHSICTLEFESARELYDWVVQATEVPWVPKQTEFARLNLNYTVMSKRKLLQLVNEGHVHGWDDPRMPTLAGMRRRGYTPEAIRDFCQRVGVARNLSTVDVALLEHTVREDLNTRSPRVLAVLRPLKVTIENWPAGEVEELDGPYWPHDVPKEGSRKIPFSGQLYIDRDDFMENPPKDFYRLAPGRSVRLRHGYIVTCTQVLKDAAGEVTELVCTYDPATRGGMAPKGKKIDGTIQWVSAAHAVDAEVRLYDRLFAVEVPGASGADFKTDLNPQSLTTVTAKVEPSLATAAVGDRFQFERLGFFYVDLDSKAGALVFNRTVSLKDSWAKAAKPAAAPAPKPARKPAAAAAPAQQAPQAAVTIDAVPELKPIYEAAVKAGAKEKAALSLLTNDVLGEIRARGLEVPPFDGAAVAELLALIDDGTLSTKLAKDVLGAMFEGEGTPRAIVEKRGLRQIGDRGQVESAVDMVLAANADAVARYRAGNANVLGALVGLTIKATGGRANPKLVTDILKSKLAGGAS